MERIVIAEAEAVAMEMNLRRHRRFSDLNFFEFILDLPHLAHKQLRLPVYHSYQFQFRQQQGASSREAPVSITDSDRRVCLQQRNGKER